MEFYPADQQLRKRLTLAIWAAARNTAMMILMLGKHERARARYTRAFLRVADRRAYPRDVDVARHSIQAMEARYVLR